MGVDLPLSSQLAAGKGAGGGMEGSQCFPWAGWKSSEP